MYNVLNLDILCLIATRLESFMRNNITRPRQKMQLLPQLKQVLYQFFDLDIKFHIAALLNSRVTF